jgi:hypothetical protein
MCLLTPVTAQTPLTLNALCCPPQVKSRTQRYMLAHEQGRAAAALSKELATLVTDLAAPPLQ